MTRNYLALGHVLQSDLELQGVPEGENRNGAETLRIRLAKLEDAPIPLPTEKFLESDYTRAGRAVLAWRDIGVFQCVEGREIIVHPAESADPFLIQQPLLGPALALTIQQKGLPVLHGSAVLTGEKAILVLAKSGTGKSTLAAALIRRGGRLISDDLCVLRKEQGQWRIFPEVPRLKLTEDAIAGIGAESRGMPAIPSDKGKRELRLAPATHTSVPVGSVYIYESGERPGIEPLDPGSRFFALRTHTFTIHVLERIGRNEENFAHCTELAQALNIRRLTRGPDISGLDALAEMVEEDAAAFDHDIPLSHTRQIHS